MLRKHVPRKLMGPDALVPTFWIGEMLHPDPQSVESLYARDRMSEAVARLLAQRALFLAQANGLVAVTFEVPDEEGATSPSKGMRLVMPATGLTAHWDGKTVANGDQRYTLHTAA